MSYIESLFEFLRTVNPYWFFTLFILLPLVGFPLSFFAILSPMIYGFWPSFMGICVSIGMNLVISYMIAKTWVRPFILRLVERRWKKRIPALNSQEEERAFIFLIRITPGPPLIFQNYILGLANVSFYRYMMISFPITTSIYFGFILTGNSIYKGEWGMFLLFTMSTVSSIVILRLFYRRLSKKQAQEI